MAAQRKTDFDRLYTAILSLETKDECRNFLEDLCTIKEMIDLSQRLNVAEMLNKGKSYSEIAIETGVSTATICRVNRCFMYGSGGYRNTIAKMHEEIEE